MYTTKQKHKCQGASFLGGPYQDPTRIKQSSRVKGKQFLTKFPKKGNPSMQGVLFEFTTRGSGTVEPYQVGNNYLKSHPLDQRKLGFGTHDAPKKDEFMSAQRAAQHKASMKSSESCEKEACYRKGPIDNQIEQLRARLDEIDSKIPGFATSKRHEDDFVGKVPSHLYNIGNTHDGTTPVFLKDSRDQFYSLKRCVASNKPRHVQKYALTSADYGLHGFEGNGKVDKMINLGPPRGGAQEFFNRGHLVVGEHHAS